MDKHTKAPEAKEGEGHRDSLGQPNPAVDLEKKNIAAAQKESEEKAKAAKKDD